MECQSRDIDVLLTYMPTSGRGNIYSESQYINKIAAKYNVDYINFVDHKLVNYQTDFFNYNHLNPSGAGKLTSFIGRYILDNYAISSHLQESPYASWADE